VIADLIGKAKRIRTIPIPAWAKRAVEEWTTVAHRRWRDPPASKSSCKVWGDGITPKAIWHE
jgi:hypothetical protein